MPGKDIYTNLLSKKERGEKSLAVLIDPDKQLPGKLRLLLDFAGKSKVDYLFVGSSVLLENNLEDCLALIKGHSEIPVVLFPGNRFQISKQADAILLLSLISGRNAELLIGQHVLAAPELKRSGLEIIPTGYLLIDGGKLTSVNYVSQTLPIPAGKKDIAAATAMAGEQLGLKLIYLEAGSGAKQPVSLNMISEVKKSVDIPLIVGGGIRESDIAAQMCRAGADIIVAGNSLEEDPALLFEITAAVKQESKSLKKIQTPII